MSPCKVFFFLNKKYTLYTDTNQFTNLDLANKLLENNIHFVDTLHLDRQDNPQKVLSKKWKWGRIYQNKIKNE